MTILENPIPSSSFRNWQNIATGFGAFCVQERTAAGRRASLLSFTSSSSGTSAKPFRIIFSHCPIDFLSLNEKLVAKTGDESMFFASSSTGGQKRFVIAVATSLASILEDWGWIMKGWQSFINNSSKSNESSNHNSSTRNSRNKNDASKDALNRQDWSEVIQLIKAEINRDKDLDAFYKNETPVPASPEAEPSDVMIDPLDPGDLGTAASSESLTPVRSMVMRTESAETPTPPVPLSPRVKSKKNGEEMEITSPVASASVTDEPFLENEPLPEDDTQKKKIAPNHYYTSDLFDIILLRHLDLWAWSSPHVSILVLVVCCLCTCTQALVVILLQALPLSLLQRRRAVDKRTKKRDQRHLDLISNFFASLVADIDSSISREDRGGAIGLGESASKKEENDENEMSTSLLSNGSMAKSNDPIVVRLQRIVRTLPFKIFIVCFLIFVIIDIFVLPSKDFFGVVDFLAGKVIAVLLLGAGLRQVLAPPAVNRHPLSNKAITALLHSTQRNIHPHIDDPSYRYRRAELNETEKMVLDQLRNFGAPYSIILLRPLREMAVGKGWTSLHMEGNVRCAHRYSHQRTTHTLRYTVNVPLCNVGTLQAVLLDDPDGIFDEYKSTNVYVWRPLLQFRQILKELDFDTKIVRSCFRSAQWGSAPSVVDQFVLPAAVLNHEQQQALNILDIVPRPSTPQGRERHRHSHLKTFVYSAIPCGTAVSELYNQPEDVPEGGSSSGAKAAAADGSSNTGAHDGGSSNQISKSNRDRHGGDSEKKSSSSSDPSSRNKNMNAGAEHTRVALTNMLLGVEEADGSLTLCFLFSYNGVSPQAGTSEDLRISDTEVQVHRLVSLLSGTGPQPNQLDDYSNTNGFQPFLCRQAFSEGNTLTLGDEANGADSENLNISFVNGRGSLVPTSTSGAATSLEADSQPPLMKRQRSLRFIHSQPLPPLCHIILRETLQPSLWRLRKERDGVRVLERTKTIRGKFDTTCRVRPLCCEMVVSSPFTTVTRALGRSDLLSMFSYTVEAKVPLGTLVPVAELLATVDNDLEATDRDSNNHTQDAAAPPAISTVLRRVGEERENACQVMHTAFRGQRGVLARDLITCEYGPYYLSAKDATQHLFDGAEQERLAPLQELSMEARLWVSAREDPSGEREGKPSTTTKGEEEEDNEEGGNAKKRSETNEKMKKKKKHRRRKPLPEIIPPLMDYERTHMARDGVVCWEIKKKKTDSSTHNNNNEEENGPQTMFKVYVAIEPSGWLPDALCAYVATERLIDAAIRFRTLIEHFGKTS